MQSPSSDASGTTQRSRLTLWLVVAACVAPVVASYIAYFFWQPSRQVNYGELIEPRSLPDSSLIRESGAPFRWMELRGRWIVVIADTSVCDERCRTKLTYARQVRLAQGKEASRIDRVWVVLDEGSPDASLLAEHPGLHVVRARGNEFPAALPAAGSPVDHIYVVDPLGLLMMRFPENPDPRLVLKDLSRLLRHSRWK